MALGQLLAQFAFIAVAFMFLKAARDTLKTGLKVSESKVIQGTPAKLIAGLLVVIGVGGVIFAIFFLPSYG